MCEFDQKLLEELAGVVAGAGRAILAAPRRSGLAAKADGSPVAAADLASHAILMEALASTLPGLVLISEESAPDDGRLPADATVVLIDPLDGTRAFIDGREDFSINLAIVRDGVPILGVIGAPSRGLVYAGASEAAWRAEVRADGALAADRRALRSRRPASRPPVGLVSDRHGDVGSEAILRRVGVAERVGLSSALKFALLAEGTADVYPRLAPTMAWDTAAGQAILAAAGGATIDERGVELRYPPGRPLRNPGFIAMGDPDVADAAVGGQ